MKKEIIKLYSYHKNILTRLIREKIGQLKLKSTILNKRKYPLQVRLEEILKLLKSK